MSDHHVVTDLDMPDTFKPALTGDQFIDDSRLVMAKLNWVHSPEFKERIRAHTRMLIAMNEQQRPPTFWESVFAPISKMFS